MRSVCFLSVLIVILWFKVCRSDETTLGSDIDSLLPHKVQPKWNIILLPPVFSVIGVTLIAISVLTTIFCIAYCVFLPWAHALSSKTIVQEVTTASPNTANAAANAPNQQPYYAGGVPPHPYYAGGGGPYFPNQPYPYYAGPQQPPATDCSTGTTTTTTGTTTTTKPVPTTSPPPDEQNVKETEEFICENI